MILKIVALKNIQTQYKYSSKVLIFNLCNKYIKRIYHIYYKKVYDTFLHDLYPELSKKKKNAPHCILKLPFAKKNAKSLRFWALEEDYERWV